MRPIDADALFEHKVNGVIGNLSGDFVPGFAIDMTPTIEINGNTSDGYHTFNELYHHRALLFSVIVSQFKDFAWKSKLHHDGTMYDGMFIVGVNTLQGQATYHYDIEPYWDMFDCKEVERAPEWDGHTSEQAIERIATLRLFEPFKTPVVHGEFERQEEEYIVGLHVTPVLCKTCDTTYFTMNKDGKRTVCCPYCGAKMDGGEKK